MVPAATSSSTPTSSAISFPLPVGFPSMLAMVSALLGRGTLEGSPRSFWQPTESNARATPASSGFRGLAPERASRDAGHPRSPARLPASGGELLADEGLERAEVALGQILEATAAGGDRRLGRVELGHRAQQVLVVLGQLDLDRPGQRRVVGQGGGRLGPIAAGVDERP